MKYSVIIPVFNSEKSIGVLIEELISFFNYEKLKLELVLINDGSTDSSWNIIKEKSEKFPHNILAIDLIYNHGQHIANYCGFKNSTGDYVITMDDDLQNPVKEIKKLIVKSNEGYDLVIGRYIDKKHSLFRRLGSKIVRYINSKVFRIPNDLHLSNFRIIKKNLIDRICQLNISYPYIPGILVHYSASNTNVIVEHMERKFGKSKYNSLKIAKLIFEILFNYSTFPLRVMTIIGFMVSVMSFFLGIFYLLKALLFGVSVQGWTTIIVLLSFMSALILMALFMLGEYMIRVIRNLTHNQSYFIREIIKHKNEKR